MVSGGESMALDFEKGSVGEGLTPAFKKLQELIVSNEFQIGGDMPTDPDTGELARLTPEGVPPEEPGAEALPPRESAVWSGEIAVTNA